MWTTLHNEFITYIAVTLTVNTCIELALCNSYCKSSRPFTTSRIYEKCTSGIGKRSQTRTTAITQYYTE